MKGHFTQKPARGATAHFGETTYCAGRNNTQVFRARTFSPIFVPPLTRRFKSIETAVVYRPFVARGVLKKVYREFPTRSRRGRKRHSDFKAAGKLAYSENGTRVGPSTMQACRGCPAMGAAMSGSYGRMLERAWRAGAPCKPC